MSTDSPLPASPTSFSRPPISDRDIVQLLSVGLVARSALLEPAMVPYLTSMQCFVTLACPHLGQTSTPLSFFKTGAWAVRKVRWFICCTYDSLFIGAWCLVLVLNTAGVFLLVYILDSSSRNSEIPVSCVDLRSFLPSFLPPLCGLPTNSRLAGVREGLPKGVDWRPELMAT